MDYNGYQRESRFTENADYEKRFTLFRYVKVSQRQCIGEIDLNVLRKKVGFEENYTSLDIQRVDPPWS